VLSRELTRRLVERAMRRRALVLPVPESFRQLTASQWRDLHPFTQRCLLDAFERESARPWIAEARLWRIDRTKPTPMPLPGPGRSVLM
jgi:hypothetical protein